MKSSLDESDTAQDRINLMTIHNGKGLEFAVTFLVGMEENLFPHINSRGNESALEEERRLCYVGITRAKRFLYMTNARTRFMRGTVLSQIPSRFIKEIPVEYTEKIKTTPGAFKAHSQSRFKG